MPGGRKSLKDEIQVVKYMTELSGPTFDYLKLCITSGDKHDKQWATEQLMKLYVKAIPQEIATDPENPPLFKLVNYANDTGPVPAQGLPGPAPSSV